MIIVPPEFTLLFLIPILGTLFIYDKTNDMSISFLFYVLSQIAIASLAHHMYG